MSVPAHMFFGAIWGYALGMRLVDRRVRVLWFPRSARGHGLFDALPIDRRHRQLAVALNMGLASVFVMMVRRALRRGSSWTKRRSRFASMSAALYRPGQASSGSRRSCCTCWPSASSCSAPSTNSRAIAPNSPFVVASSLDARSPSPLPRYGVSAIHAARRGHRHVRRHLRRGRTPVEPHSRLRREAAITSRLDCEVDPSASPRLERTGRGARARSPRSSARTASSASRRWRCDVRRRTSPRAFTTYVLTLPRSARACRRVAADDLDELDVELERTPSAGSCRRCPSRRGDPFPTGW